MCTKKAHEGTNLRSAAWFVVAAVLAACFRGKVSPAPSGEPPPRARIVSFRDEVYPVLAKYCADSTGCHGTEPTHSVELDLRPTAAYFELVGAASEARPGTARVQPNNAAASFLLDKLEGSLRPHEGKPMPLDADTGEPLIPSPLPPGFVEDVLRPWISAGAPNN